MVSGERFSEATFAPTQLMKQILLDKITLKKATESDWERPPAMPMGSAKALEMATASAMEKVCDGAWASLAAARYMERFH
jgi:hypothetical protein